LCSLTPWFARQKHQLVLTYNGYPAEKEPYAPGEPFFFDYLIDDSLQLEPPIFSWVAGKSIIPPLPLW